MYKGNTVICKDHLANEHAKQIKEAKMGSYTSQAPFTQVTHTPTHLKSVELQDARSSLGLIST